MTQMPNLLDFVLLNFLQPNHSKNTFQSSQHHPYQYYFVARQFQISSYDLTLNPHRLQQTLPIITQFIHLFGTFVHLFTWWSGTSRILLTFMKLISLGILTTAAPPHNKHCGLSGINVWYQMWFRKSSDKQNH